MKAGIIAAGEGSRLRAEGIAVPKPLVQVDGVPLIERLLKIFNRNDIADVVCIVNEYSLDVKQHVEREGFRVRFLVKTTPSSMHSLFALAPYLNDEQFLLTTVDSIFDEEEFAGFLRFARSRTSVDGVLAVTDFVDDENPLYVDVGDGNRVVSLGPRSSGTVAGGLVTGGLYVFRGRIFSEIDAVLASGIERLRNFLSYLLDRGYAIEAYKFSKIVDVDRAADIRVAEEMLRSKL